MNDSSHTPSSSSAVIGISDRDIDRLLREAEALTGAIEADAQFLSSESDEETQINETADDLACETDSQESNDAKTATDPPDGFKDLLHDPDADLDPETATEAVTATDADSEQPTERDEEAADTNSEDAASLSEDRHSDEVIEPDAAPADETGKIETSEHDVTVGDSESAESNDHTSTDERQDADAECEQTTSSSEPGSPRPCEDADEESEQVTSEGVLDESRSPVAVFKKKLSQFIGLATRSGVAVPAIAINAVMSVFVFFDRPFTRVPMGIKRVLGYLAIATLLSGIATRFLPDMLNHNPFAEMGTGTQQVG